MKKILTTLTLLVSALSLFAQGGKNITNAAFREVRTPVTQDAQVIKLTGKMTYKADNYLSLNYDNGELFLIDGDKMTINMDGQKNDFDLTKNLMMRSLSHVLLYSMEGKFDALAAEQKCDIKTETKNGQYIVTLTAKKRGVKGYGMIVVTYDDKTKSIRSMRMDEFTGASTYYELITK